jgi:uncharacterized membrane protein
MRSAAAIAAAVAIVAAFFLIVYRAPPVVAVLGVAELIAMLALALGVAWATAQRSAGRFARPRPRVSTRSSPDRDRAR